ncbi:MAG: type II restriction endonuclease [Actinomycetota bacterium]|nr:type II restriction endonuclease [Actinomycetota bacterium]
MKYLNTYKNLGLENDENKIFDYFIKTLKESIYTWEYFVNWKKIIKNTKSIEKELNILNYLIGKEDIEEEFLKLIKEYPNVKKVLPILLAIREDKLKELQIITDFDNFTYEEIYDIFYKECLPTTEDKLKKFFIDSGLRDIFKNRRIKNLVDYCYGVEVGLDTNARKNRTGKLMEKIVEKYLKNFTSKFKLEYLCQATKAKIENNFNYSIKVDKYDREFDFSLMDKDKNKIYLIEVNYYGGGGSKLKATAGEYIELNNILKRQNIEFIWITDGNGWKKSKNPLYKTFTSNDYTFNLELLYSGALEEVMLY